MDKLVLIDGNSIMNRAFYGIMGSKMLTTKDGKYTNAVYGFLAILFNIIDDIKPEYIAVAFDLKGKLKRKELFEGYKANRHGMPDELAEQMPVIKDVLRAMNIDIVEKICDRVVFIHKGKILNTYDLHSDLKKGFSLSDEFFKLVKENSDD